MSDAAPGGILDLTRLKADQIVGIEPLDEKWHHTTITWNIGRRCNFACSYCEKDLHDKVSPHRSFDEFVKAWLRLRRVVAMTGQTAQIIFTGGEPTLNPNFLQFVEYLNRTQRRWISQIGLTTNGSQSLDYYKTLLAELDVVSFSTHFEWWDEYSFMTTLLDLWRQTGKNTQGTWIYVNAMYENWDAAGVRKVREILKAEGIPQTPYKIINFYGSKGIVNTTSTPFDHAAYLRERGEDHGRDAAASHGGGDKLTEILVDDQQAPDNVDVLLRLADGTVGKSNSTQMMNFGLTNFPGWTCNVQRSLYIHNDGAIWAGVCKFKKLGDVYDGFTPLSQPVTCDGRLCVCTIDIQIEKFNPDIGQSQQIAPEWHRDSYDRPAKSV